MVKITGGCRWLRRLFISCAALLVLGAVAVVARSMYAFRDRHPGYRMALEIDGKAGRSRLQTLRVGFGRATINPDLSDPARPVWLAGFDNGRAATAQHDDLWTVACVIDDGYTRLAIVGLDSIGIFHDDVIEVRRRMPADWKIDYSVIAASHNHSTPDTMGLWGPNLLHSGADPGYLEHVRSAILKSIGDAAAGLQPARMALYEIPVNPAGLVADTRKPEVLDPDLRLMLFSEPGSGRILGSIVSWANHPETPWGRSTEITADFPGVLRESLEKGIIYEGRVRLPGLGGTHVYINGAIGGLMTTSPNVSVHDPFLNQEYQKPSHEKSRAVGNSLADLILRRVASESQPAADAAPISVFARTIEIPIANMNFLLAPVLGLLDRGHSHWRMMRTEVALVVVGDAAIACLPGEVYPELVNGGVVRAPGGDFDVEPVEIPTIREQMPGRIKFIFGLANDEIGYIIPKSEWDEKPPYLFEAPKPVYGEVNSCGPETAPALHRALSELIRRERETR